jgi:hypothetical protein
MNLHRQRDYFRLDQNEVLSTPIEIARTLPDDILKLAGYCKLSCRICELCMEADLTYEQTRQSVASATLKTTKVRWSLCRDMIMELASMGRPARI